MHLRELLRELASVLPGGPPDHGTRVNPALRCAQGGGRHHRGQVDVERRNRVANRWRLAIGDAIQTAVSPATRAEDHLQQTLAVLGQARGRVSRLPPRPPVVQG